MPAPAPTPEQREQELASMREAEQRALAQLKADPTGAQSIEDVGAEEAALIAMLAGSTAQNLKQAKFVDNVMAPTASQVLDPRQVVGELAKKASGKRPTPSPAAPGVDIQHQTVISVPVRDVNDPQLELDLFKKMNMTDVYNVISELKDEIILLKRAVFDVKKYLDDTAR